MCLSVLLLFVISKIRVGEDSREQWYLLQQLFLFLILNPHNFLISYILITVWYKYFPVEYILLKLLLYQVSGVTILVICLAAILTIVILQDNFQFKDRMKLNLTYILILKFYTNDVILAFFLPILWLILATTLFFSVTHNISITES